MGTVSAAGLTSWLREAILERKARAEALAVTVGAAGWTVRRNDDFDYTVHGSDPDEPLADIWREDTAEWMAANDPESVIAQCEAELAILDECETALRIARTYKDGDGMLALVCAKTWCDAVRLLAGGYRHWPGRKAQWLP